MNRIPQELLQDYIRSPGEEDDAEDEEPSQPPTLSPDAGVFARIHYAVWSSVWPWLPSRRLSMSLLNVGIFVGTVVLINQLHRLLVMFDLAQGLPPADLANYPRLKQREAMEQAGADKMPPETFGQEDDLIDYPIIDEEGYLVEAKAPFFDPWEEGRQWKRSLEEGYDEYDPLKIEDFEEE